MQHYEYALSSIFRYLLNRNLEPQVHMNDYDYEPKHKPSYYKRVFSLDSVLSYNDAGGYYEDIMISK